MGEAPRTAHMNFHIAQILTQIIGFLVALWILKRYAWKPLLGILDERRAKISGELDTIEQEKGRVEELKQEKLIQEPAPLPWRDEELKYVVRGLGIEERRQAMGFQQPPNP